MKKNDQRLDNHQAVNQYANEKNVHHKDESQSENRLKNKTATVALSILLMASIGLLVFGLTLKEPSSNENAAFQGSRSLRILAEEKKQGSPSLVASLSPPRREGEYSDLTNLREANQIQSNKIKTLQQQLIEATVKLHDIKAHLFTKENPKDKTRIASLSLDLAEKEQTRLELLDEISALEEENEHYIKQIKRMEQDVDSLSSLADSQKEAKENILSNYRLTTEQLQSNIKSVRKDLEDTKKELETARQVLENSLTDKSTAIENLKTHIRGLNQVIAEKDQKIESQENFHQSSKRSFDSQLQNLFNDISAAELKYNLLINENNENKEQIAALNDAIQNQENKLNQTHQDFAELQMQLEELHSKLDNANQENRTLDHHLALLNQDKAEAHHHVLSLTTSLQEHSEHIGVLQNDLAGKEENIKNLMNHIATLTQQTEELKNLRDELYALDEENHAMALLSDQQIASLNKTLEKAYLNAFEETQVNQLLVEKLKSDIGAHIDTLAFLHNRLDEKKKEIDQLAHELTQEKDINSLLASRLILTEAEGETTRSHALSLEAHLVETPRLIVFMHDALADKQNQILALQNQIQDSNKFQSEIDRLQKENEKLAAKNEEQMKLLLQLDDLIDRMN